MNNEFANSASDLFDLAKGADRLICELEEYAAHVATQLSATPVSTHMFRRMGGMWLMHLVHQCLLTSEDSTDSSSDVLVIPFDAWSHHIEFMSSAQYRSQLHRLWRMAPSQIVATAMTAHLVIRQPERMNRIRLAIQTLLQLGSRPSPNVLIVRPYLKLTAYKRLLAIAKSRHRLSWNDMNYVIGDVTQPDIGKRRALIESSWSDSRINRLKAIIALIMPIGYAEGFEAASRDLLQRFRQPRVLYSATAFQFHYPYQVLSALWGESGTLVVSHQHGGHEGLDEFHAGEAYEKKASDRHYTLGWVDANENLQPMPTAMPRRSRAVDPRRLLVMFGSTTRVGYRIQPNCLPTHGEWCAMETREFLSILRWSSPPVLRGSDADFFGLDQQEFVSKESLSSSGSLSASRSRLVVHNYLGVSWLETLAMNTPTVCFSPAAITKFRDAAQPFVDGLRRVGILHPSGREAAEFINSLDDRIEEWWQSGEVQAARRSFVERYANFSDDWLKEWLIEFDRLLQST